MIKSELLFKNLPLLVRENLKNAKVFYSQNYHKYLLNSSARPIYLFDEGIVLIVVIRSKYVFKYADIPCTPFIYNPNNAKIQVFLDEAMKYLKEVMKIQWVNTTYATAVFPNYPAFSKRIKFGTYLIDLKEKEDILWSRIHSKHKNSIRKAQKSNIMIRFGGDELLNEYLKLDQQTWERSGSKSIGKHFFEKFIRNLNDNIIICLAIHENVPQGGAIILYNQQCGYYLYGATKNNPESGAMNLLQWEIIRFLKLQDVQLYDFVGARIKVDKDSKYSNIQRFKERFGGEFQVGYMFKIINNPLAYKVFKLLTQLKNGKSSIDPVDQEFLKWTEIN